MTEDWTTWEGEVINGVFPLRRFLGRSDHSAVFLTEYKPAELLDAAIKLIPAVAERTEAQLAHWTSAAALQHPHLIRLFEAGRCRRGEREFLFVVMEYAEQNLAQLLPHRALTADEVREMLLPSLDALAYLHRNGLVQGRLKPPNVLVVADQLKLASDTVCRAGDSTAGIAETSPYAPPEEKSAVVSAAGDMWALGITSVEALTQSLPVWSDERSETVLLPATCPAEIAGTLRLCLSRDPARRPTAAALEAELKGSPQASAAPVAPPTAHDAPQGGPSSMRWPQSRWLVGAGATVLMGLIAVWIGSLLSRSHPDARQPAAGTKESSPQQGPPPAAPAGSQPAKSAPARVLHEEIPLVSPGAQKGIRGRIKVTVRATVDPSGDVVDAALENPGPSKYFARLASDAARKWKFAAADDQEARVLLLRFEFTRTGTSAGAAAFGP